MRHLLHLALAVLGLGSVMAGAGAVAQGLPLPSAAVDSVFHIAKSENKNQVHYALEVDERCRPSGATPVRGYWREYEVGPRVVDSLRDHQQRAYGVSAPRVRRSEAGGDVRLSLRALPDRPLRINAFREGERCRARAFAKIRGEPAVLTSIYVDLGFLYSVDYILLRGVRVRDGARIEERIED